MTGIPPLYVGPSPSPEAPYSVTQLLAGLKAALFPSYPKESQVWQLLNEYRPEVLLVSSWHIDSYRKVARKTRGRLVRVLCMDNQWHGTLKQWAGRLISSWYIDPLYDAAFVPGWEQVRFAQYLGFDSRRIWTGLYSTEPMPTAFSPASRFVFIGRLSEEKGLRTLAKAFSRYQSIMGHDAWPLELFGTGPLAALFREHSGVHLHGFLQPEELRDRAYGRGGILILPSRFEPWGMVVSEAATAGMPVICSSACGAAHHLVRPHGNGLIVESGSVAELSNALVQFHLKPQTELELMGQLSRTLAAPYRPDIWARTVLNGARELELTQNIGVP